MKKNKNDIVFAIPKGRIFNELKPLLDKASIKIESDFYDEDSRKLFFATSIDNVKIIRCRSYDIATFVAFGAADIAVCGEDVIAEFAYKNIYNLLDLKIGKCRLSLAKTKGDKSFKEYNSLKIASKYPKLTRKYLESQNIQTELVKLNGAIELAPKLGLSDYIVDLVSSGATLKANNLVEDEVILDVTSKLIVNKASLIRNVDFIESIITKFKEVIDGK